MEMSFLAQRDPELNTNRKEKKGGNAREQKRLEYQKRRLAQKYVS
jgi:hypothetical protein